MPNKRQIIKLLDTIDDINRCSPNRDCCTVTFSTTTPTTVAWIIQTQASAHTPLQGTVEEVSDTGLLWHITSPVVKDIWYGIVGDTPATWIDSSDGSEQMAVIRGDITKATSAVYLDKGLTGGVAEINLKITDITIISTKPGYTTQISYIPPTPPTGSTTGTLYITSTPSGAEIYLDGIDQRVKTPNFVAHISAGNHTVKLTLNGYTDYTQTVNVAVGTTVTITTSLISITPTTTGSLNITSTPSEAEIFIDNIDQRVITPNTITGLSAGTHTFTLKLTGYNDTSGSTTIVGGTSIDVHATLTLVTPTTGSLDIISTPEGAEVFIDGIDQRTTTATVITNLVPGHHKVELIKSGYQNFTITVTITARTTSYINPTLAIITTPILNTGTIIGIAVVAGILGVIIISRKKQIHSINLVK